MANSIIKEELKKINELIPKIERFEDYNLSDIPEVYRKELSAIKIIPPFTAGGLESMVSILNSLYLAKEIAEREIKKEEESEKSYVGGIKAPLEVKKPMPQTKPQPRVPTSKPQNIAPKPAISQDIAKKPSSSPQKVEEKYKIEKPLDLGPYGK